MRTRSDFATCYDAFSRGDFDAVLGMCTAHIVFEVPGQSKVAGLYPGKWVVVHKQQLAHGTPRRSTRLVLLPPPTPPAQEPLTKSAPRIVEPGVALYPRPAGDSSDCDGMGCIADESPEWTREDQAGHCGTRTVTLVPVPAAGPDGGEASARLRTRRRVAIGLDRLIRYATCEGDGKDI